MTLHEYMMHTKAVEYIIAVIFLTAFIVFWRFVGAAPRKRTHKTGSHDP